MDSATTIILVGIGILLEAFFSGSEIGMVSVNRIKMKHRGREEVRGYRFVISVANVAVNGL